MVNINWRTLSEVNCDHFTVERSTNNRDYTTVSTVGGSGNSTSANLYAVVDDKPLHGISYYRLKQTDFDGNTTVYPPVSVSFSTSTDFNVYPTVSNGRDIHLSATNDDIDTYDITVQNLNGSTIPSTVRPNGSGLDLSIDEKYSNANGVYLVTATRGNEVLRNKIVISKSY